MSFSNTTTTTTTPATTGDGGDNADVREFRLAAEGFSNLLTSDPLAFVIQSRAVDLAVSGRPNFGLELSSKDCAQVGKAELAGADIVRLAQRLAAAADTPDMVRPMVIMLEAAAAKVLSAAEKAAPTHAELLTLAAAASRQQNNTSRRRRRGSSSSSRRRPPRPGADMDTDSELDLWQAAFKLMEVLRSLVGNAFKDSGPLGPKGQVHVVVSPLQALSETSANKKKKTLPTDVEMKEEEKVEEKDEEEIDTSVPVPDKCKVRKRAKPDDHYLNPVRLYFTVNPLCEPDALKCDEIVKRATVYEKAAMRMSGNTSSSTASSLERHTRRRNGDLVNYLGLETKRYTCSLLEEADMQFDGTRPVLDPTTGEAKHQLTQLGQSRRRKYRNAPSLVPANWQPEHVRQFCAAFERHVVKPMRRRRDAARVWQYVVAEAVLIFLQFQMHRVVNAAAKHNPIAGLVLKEADAFTLEHWNAIVARLGLQAWLNAAAMTRVTNAFLQGYQGNGIYQRPITQGALHLREACRQFATETESFEQVLARQTIKYRELVPVRTSEAVRDALCKMRTNVYMTHAAQAMAVGTQPFFDRMGSLVVMTVLDETLAAAATTTGCSQTRLDERLHPYTSAALLQHIQKAVDLVMTVLAAASDEPPVPATTATATQGSAPVPMFRPTPPMLLRQPAIDRRDFVKLKRNPPVPVTVPPPQLQPVVLTEETLMTPTAFVARLTRAAKKAMAAFASDASAVMARQLLIQARFMMALLAVHMRLREFNTQTGQSLCRSMKAVFLDPLVRYMQEAVSDVKAAAAAVASKSGGGGGVSVLSDAALHDTLRRRIWDGRIAWLWHSSSFQALHCVERGTGGVSRVPVHTAAVFDCLARHASTLGLFCAALEPTDGLRITSLVARPTPRPFVPAMRRALQQLVMNVCMHTSAVKLFGV